MALQTWNRLRVSWVTTHVVLEYGYMENTICLETAEKAYSSAHYRPLADTVELFIYQHIWSFQRFHQGTIIPSSTRLVVLLLRIHHLALPESAVTYP